MAARPLGAADTSVSWLTWAPLGAHTPGELLVFAGRWLARPIGQLVIGVAAVLLLCSAVLWVSLARP